MRIINHIEEDPATAFLDDDEKWLDNRLEPIVRIGGEPFESHYESEFHIETYIADPRRSFVKPLYQMSDKWVDGAWWVADFLACFLLDLGFNLSNPTKAMSVAFWTMFPEGVSRHLSVSWRRIACFNRCHCEMPRVINNPFFYCDSNVAEKRLLQIVEDAGCTYAVDLANPYENAEALAREIALLNHIHEGDAAVGFAYGIILPQITDAVGTEEKGCHLEEVGEKTGATGGTSETGVKGSGGTCGTGGTVACLARHARLARHTNSKERLIQ